MAAVAMVGLWAAASAGVLAGAEAPAPAESPGPAAGAEAPPLPGPAETADQAPPDTGDNSAKPEKPALTDGKSPRADKGDKDLLGGRPETNLGRLLGQSLAAVLVILALGGAGIFVVKRLLPRIGVNQGRRITVLETVYLGPRKSLHLVQVGDRTVLVGGTREHVSLLTDVTGSVNVDGAVPGGVPALGGRRKAKFVIPGVDEEKGPPQFGQGRDSLGRGHDSPAAADGPEQT